MDYIKAPKAVAKLVGQSENRGVFPDGNFMLWERDLLSLMPYDLEALGCKRLTAPEVIAEHNGGEAAPLPAPTDPRITGLTEEGGEL